MNNLLIRFICILSIFFQPIFSYADLSDVGESAPEQTFLVVYDEAFIEGKSRLFSVVTLIDDGEAVSYRSCQYSKKERKSDCRPNGDPISKTDIERFQTLIQEKVWEGKSAPNRVLGGLVVGGILFFLLARSGIGLPYLGSGGPASMGDALIIGGIGAVTSGVLFAIVPDKSGSAIDNQNQLIDNISDKMTNQQLNDPFSKVVASLPKDLKSKKVYFSAVPSVVGLLDTVTDFDMLMNALEEK